MQENNRGSNRHGYNFLEGEWAGRPFLGFDDIDFESAEFSRRFYVKAPDRRWAYDVIHARIMEFLLAMPRFTIQFDRRCALARDSSTFATGRFADAAEVLRGILDRLPGYLVEQQRERS